MKLLQVLCGCFGSGERDDDEPVARSAEVGPSGDLSGITVGNSEKQVELSSITRKDSVDGRAPQKAPQKIKFANAQEAAAYLRQHQKRVYEAFEKKPPVVAPEYEVNPKTKVRIGRSLSIHEHTSSFDAGSSNT